MSRVSLGWISVLMWACDPVDPCELSDEASMVIGQGEEMLVPLEEGDPFLLDFGMQGGQHVWLSMETRGIDPGKALTPFKNPGPLVEATLTTGDVEFGSGWSYQSVLEGNHKRATLLGLQVFVDLYMYLDGEDWEMEEDALWTLDLTLSDSCGTTLEQSIEAPWAWR